MTKIDHLALAREDLAIAESGNAKREAYKRAADHIADYQAEACACPDTTTRGGARRLHAPKCAASYRAIAAELQLSDSKYGGEKYVADLLKWRGTGFKAETPFVMDEQATTRAAKSHAKAVLRDATQRGNVLDALDEEDLLDVATDAAQKVSEKVWAEGRERKRDARANREERSTDPSGTHLKLIRLDLAKADDAIARAINTARDAGWSEKQTEQLLARIAKTEGLIAVLKLAVTNETDIDWDAALAKLVEEEQAA